MEFVVENLSPTRKKIAFTLTADDVNAAINTAVKGFQKDLSLPGFRSETLLHFLSERGVMVSSGSACAKGAKSPYNGGDTSGKIVDILLETVCTSRKSIRVAGDDYPAELVKAKFLKLDSHHIEFVMDCLRDNTTKVRNIKQYLRAMLFNAPSTINSYYASLVAHDMAQPDWGRPPNT